MHGHITGNNSPPGEELIISKRIFGIIFEHLTKFRYHETIIFCYTGIQHARHQRSNRSKIHFRDKRPGWYYQNYYPKFGIGGKINGFFEVTSFDYKVTAVKDSAGTTYSYITKTGTGCQYGRYPMAPRLRDPVGQPVPYPPPGFLSY